MRKRPSRPLTRAAVTALVPLFLIALNASAQEGPRNSGGMAPAGSAAAGGPSGGSSGGSSSGGGSSSASSGGGSSSNTGSSMGSPFAGSGGGPSGVRSAGDGTPRGVATGGGGVAVGRAVHGASNDAYRTSGAGYSDHTLGRTMGVEITGRTADSVGSAPAYSRPRDGAASQGTAVPRGSVPITGAGGGIVAIGGGSGYYGGYYGGSYGVGYSDCSSFYGYAAPISSSHPCGYYAPMFGGAAFGSVYNDPWYGGGYGSLATSSDSGSYQTTDDSGLRLKIKPRNAEVYVDGYFVGIVNDFDGMFQKLHIESGAHRVEVRAPGYETLDIDVRLISGNTTVYTGELKKIQ